MEENVCLTTLYSILVDHSKKITFITSNSKPFITSSKKLTYFMIENFWLGIGYRILLGFFLL